MLRHYNVVNNIIVNTYRRITTNFNNGICNAGVMVEQLPFAPSTWLPCVQVDKKPVCIIQHILSIHIICTQLKHCLCSAAPIGLYPLIWAEPKTIATSAILYLIKFVSYHFTVKPPCFYGTNRNPLKRAF